MTSTGKTTVVALGVQHAHTLGALDIETSRAEAAEAALAARLAVLEAAAPKPPPPPPPPPPLPPPPTGARPFPAPVTAQTIPLPPTITTGSAFNAWVAGKSAAIIEFPPGAAIDLDVGLKLERFSNIVLRLNGATLRVKGPGNVPNSSPFVLRDCAHIAIEGPATVVGNNPDIGNIFVPGQENSHVLALSGWYGLGPSSFVEITGVDARGIYGDFAYLEGNNIPGDRRPSDHVWVHGNKGTYIGRNAISLINVTDVWEGGNAWDRVGMDIVDIEPNFTAEQVRRCHVLQGDIVGSYGHMSQYDGWLLNSWAVDAATVVEDIVVGDAVLDTVVAGNPAGGKPGSGIRALHVQFTDHADTRRVTVRHLKTELKAPGPVIRISSADGVIVPLATIAQPLLSGALTNGFPGCSGVVTT